MLLCPLLVGLDAHYDDVPHAAASVLLSLCPGRFGSGSGTQKCSPRI